MHGYALFDTTLGRCAIAWGERGIACVELPGRDDDATVRRIRRALPDAIEMAAPEHISQAIAAIQRLLAGEPEDLADVVVDLDGVPDFHRRVYDAARAIRPGETRSYGDIARTLGEPGAAQAVGRALGSNPIPFIIPCHRVVGSSGSLTGYAFGLPFKRRVLEQEGIDPDALEATVRRGERFTGCRTTRIFCFPTCHHARRVQPANVVPFRTEAEALAAGYRACRACRPAAAI